jgi:response regulator of citrate/malate metabolism
MITILIVDDDYRVANIHAAYVDRVPGFEVVGQAHTVADADQAVAELQPDLVLLDLYLPDGNGLDLMSRLLERHIALHVPCPGFVVITAARDVASVRSAMQFGAVHYLVKPFGFQALQERLLSYQALHKRLTDLDEAADQADVDALYGLLRGPAVLPSDPPKGHSAPTLALVRDAVCSADRDLSAAEIAEAVGISRPTAHRYLMYLAKQGVIELHLKYGETGRPEHRYRVRR